MKRKVKRKVIKTPDDFDKMPLRYEPKYRGNFLIDLYEAIRVGKIKR